MGAYLTPPALHESPAGNRSPVGKCSFTTNRGKVLPWSAVTRVTLCYDLGPPADEYWWDIWHAKDSNDFAMVKGQPLSCSRVDYSEEIKARIYWNIRHCAGGTVKEVD